VQRSISFRNSFGKQFHIPSFVTSRSRHPACLEMTSKHLVKFDKSLAEELLSAEVNALPSIVTLSTTLQQSRVLAGSPDGSKGASAEGKADNAEGNHRVPSLATDNSRWIHMRRNEDDAFERNWKSIDRSLIRILITPFIQFIQRTSLYHVIRY